MSTPEARNAQNLAMGYELNAAFDRAALDDGIKVIVLAAADPHFSSGQGHFAREREIYLQNTRRWRNLVKPTIAAVQGRCIASGLMLAWACDLIVASDDALFCDPVLTMGVCGGRVVRASLGAGCAQGQGVSLHRR